MSAGLHLVRTCPEPDRLDRVSTGTAESAERETVLQHAVGCADCREALLALSLAGNPGTAEEEALLARTLAQPPRPVPLPVAPPATVARPRWKVRTLATVAAVACAAGIGVVLVTREEPAETVLLALAADTRPTEGRLSLGLPYAPYRPTRGQAGVTTPLDAALAELLERKPRDPAGTARPLAALYLRRSEAGDLARAETALQAATPGPEVDNDRAVLLLAQGRAEEALRALRGAIAARPDFPAARFNVAVTLEALGRRAEAAAALRDYLALADVAGPEARWVAEARERLVRLERADR